MCMKRFRAGSPAAGLYLIKSLNFTSPSCSCCWCLLDHFFNLIICQILWLAVRCSTFKKSVVQFFFFFWSEILVFYLLLSTH